MNNFDDFNDLDNHIILYAKGWYKEVNLIDDLSQIIKVYGGHSQDFKFPKTEVLATVSETLHKILKNNFTQNDMSILYMDLWKDYTKFFSPLKESVTVEDIIESHLRVIRNKKRQYLPSLKAPDDSYLPLKSSLSNWYKMNPVIESV